MHVQSDDAMPDSDDCHPADQGLADAMREDWHEVEANFRPPTLQRRRLRARAPVCLPTPGSDFQGHFLLTKESVGPMEGWAFKTGDEGLAGGWCPASQDAAVP